MALSSDLCNVYIAVADHDSATVHHVELPGGPEEVRAGATERALFHLLRRTGLVVAPAGV
jgi:nicotinamide mononucleotide (NMN) deamidase PncC